MKKLILCLMLLGFGLSVLAQKTVSSQRQSLLIKTIEETASKIHSMECKFRQVKSLGILNEDLTSTGVMYYRQPACLRWEYIHPYDYIFIIKDSKVMIKNSFQRNVIDAKQSKLFSEIIQIMLNSVTGKCLTKDSDFRVTISEGKNVIANLKPLKKELKSMFKLIRLYINPQKYIISQVELIENTGDVTHIFLSDYKINANINDKVFTIN